MAVSKRERTRLALKIKKRQDEISTYFLEHVAPLELAVEPAVQDIRDKLRIVSGQDDLELELVKLRSALKLGIELRFLRFLLSLGDVSISDQKRTVEKYYGETKPRKELPDLQKLLQLYSQEERAKPYMPGLPKVQRRS